MVREIVKNENQLTKSLKRVEKNEGKLAKDIIQMIQSIDKEEYLIAIYYFVKAMFDKTERNIFKWSEK